MTYQRLPYDDAAPTTEMISDCAVVGRVLHLSPEQLDPSLGGPFEPAARDEIVVPDSLAELAREMQLPLG